MHIVTRDGAKLNGHRFKAGVILDLPAPEAAILIDGDMADFLEPMQVDEAPAEAPVVKRRAKA